MHRLPRPHPLVLLAAACALGCTDPGEAPSQWVGALPGTDLALALTSEGDGALRAYVCGGPDTYATHSRWFEGTLTADGAFDAVREGWALTGDAGPDGASGTLTSPDGDELPFDAHPATAPLEGLYFALDSGCRTGAVVWTGAAGEPSLQGTWCDDQSHFEQVTPVLPITLTAEGIHVRVDRTEIGMDKLDLYVEPISAAH